MAIVTTVPSPVFSLPSRNFYSIGSATVSRHYQAVGTLPRRTTKTLDPIRQTLKNVSFESMVACWLMHDGWEVFAPMLDHGHKTDLLISDGPNFHRLQVKTFTSAGNAQRIENCWKGSCIDFLILFARNGDWGIIAPAFQEKSRELLHKSHRKFKRTQREFLRNFHQL